jgi:hypothetical protein
VIYVSVIGGACVRYRRGAGVQMAVRVDGKRHEVQLTWPVVRAIEAAAQQARKRKVKP